MIRKHYFLIDDEHWNRLKSTGKLVGRVEIPQTGDGHNLPIIFPFGKSRLRRKLKSVVSTEHGWVGRTAKRYAAYQSVPAELGPVEAAAIMKRDIQKGMEVLK